MTSNIWACMSVAMLVTAGAWAGGDGPGDTDPAPILEPQDIEDIQEVVREALESAHKALRDTHGDLREEHRERIRGGARIQASERDEIREGIREVLRESQDALRDAGDAVRELFAQSVPAFHDSIGPMLIPSMTLGESGAGKSRPVDETKPAAGVNDIQIRNVSGRTIIVGWDQDTINVKGSLGEDVEELIFTTEGSSAEVRVKVPERHRNMKLQSDLTISVPKRLRVDGNTVSGGIEASGIDGLRVSLQSVSGGVNVRACSGEIQAHTTSGGIEIHDATKAVDAECVSGGIEIYGTPTVVSAETVSGGVIVEGVQNQVSAESVSGRVRVRGGKLERFSAESISGGVEYEGAMAPGAHFDLSTLSGGIRLLFTEEVSAEFDLSSFSGGIEVDLPGAPSSGKKQLSFKVGNGDASVDAEAFSGGVRVGRK